MTSLIPSSASRLFVQKSADDQWEHLAFARRERRVAQLQSSTFGSLQPCVSVARDGRVHRRHEVRLAERFRQKVDRAGFDRANRRWNVAVSGDEHDWRVVRVAKLLLEIQAADVRQFHVQDEAGRQIGLLVRDVLGDRSEGDGRHAE